MSRSGPRRPRRGSRCRGGARRAVLLACLGAAAFLTLLPLAARRDPAPTESRVVVPPPSRLRGAPREAPAAFQKGLGHRRRGETPLARKAFAAAFEAYRREGDLEGQVDALRLRGVVEYESGAPSRAYPILLQALEVARPAAVPGARARTLTDLGIASYHLGRHERAAGYYREALRVEVDAGHEEDQASILNLLGRLYDKFGRAEEAEVAYRSALRLARRRRHAVRWAGALRNLGGLAARRGSPAEAIDLERRALALYEEHRIDSGRADSLKVLGVLLEQTGRPQEAVDSLRRACRSFAELGDAAGLERCLLTLAGIHETLGQRWAARECHRRLPSLERGSFGDFLSAPVSSLLADSSAARGDLRRAVGHRERALDLWRAGGGLRGQARALIDLGDCYLQLGEIPAALDRLREGLDLYRVQSDRRGALGALKTIAAAYLHAGRPTAALEAQELAVKTAAELGETVAHATASLEMAGTLALIGRRPEALVVAERVAAFARAAGLSVLHWRSAAAAARLSSALGERSRAEESWRRAIAAIEEAGDSVRESDLMVRFFDAERRVYDELLLHLAEGGRLEEALEVSERSRARALRSLLGRRSDGAPGRKACPGCGSRAESPPRRSPGPPAALVAVYHALPDRLLLWLLDERGLLETAVVPVSLDSLGRRVRRALSLLRSERGPARGRGAEASSLRAALRDLYGLLLEPFEESLKERRGGALRLVPHGPLLEAPFACLLDAGDRYLLERFVLSSAVCLCRAETGATDGRRRRWGNGVALLAADPRAPGAGWLPLPGARAEVRAVAALLRRGGAFRARQEVRVCVGKEATEETLRALAPRCELLHLAVHAAARRQGEWSPRLLLAPTGRDPPRDGELGADEILEMKIGADLVVLSGCETGRGELTSDGVLGLPRSFLAAGAASVIHSSWKVEDRATRALFVSFYRHLSAGESKARALRSAQLSLLSRGGQPARRSHQAHRTAPRQVAPRSPAHPASWAGFSLLGAP